MQWCQTNFSSIEDIENCQNRGGFRQNIESIGRGIEQLPAWLAWGVPLLHKPTT
jgi:hypothetical protein